MWIIIVIVFFLILCWLLLTPLELHVDTRIPQASLRWITIGKAFVVYDNERWRLNIRLLFFYKQWDLEKLIAGSKQKRKQVQKHNKKTASKKGKFQRFLKLIKTFRITNWKVAIDTGDTVKNAWLYPLNFIPDTRRHFHINFEDENYLVFSVRNAPWKLVYAFFR